MYDQTQVTTIYTVKCDIDCSIKRLSYFFISLLYFINYCCFYFNIHTVSVTGSLLVIYHIKCWDFFCDTLQLLQFSCKQIKESIEHMQLDWKTLENSDEIKILDRYLFGSYVLTLSALCKSQPWYRKHMRRSYICILITHPVICIYFSFPYLDWSRNVSLRIQTFYPRYYCTN